MPIAKVKKEITFGGTGADYRSGSVVDVLRLKKGKIVNVLSDVNQPGDVHIEIPLTNEGNITLERYVRDRIFAEYFAIVKEPTTKQQIKEIEPPLQKINKKLNFIKHT